MTSTSLRPIGPLSKHRCHVLFFCHPSRRFFQTTRPTTVHVASKQRSTNHDRSNHPAPPHSLNTEDTATPESPAFKGFQPLKKTPIITKPTKERKEKKKTQDTTDTTDISLKVKNIRQKVVYYQQHGFPSQFQSTPQWLQQLALRLAEPLSFPYIHEPSKTKEVIAILPPPSIYNPPPPDDGGGTDDAPDAHDAELNSSTIQQQQQEQQQQDLPEGDNIRDKKEDIFSSELSSILEHHRGKVATNLGISNSDGSGGSADQQQGSTSTMDTSTPPSFSSSSSVSSSSDRIDARSLQTLYKLLANIGGSSLPMTLFFHLYERNGIGMLDSMKRMEKEQALDVKRLEQIRYLRQEVRQGRWTYPLYDAHCISVILQEMVNEGKDGVELGVEFLTAVLETTVSHDDDNDDDNREGKERTNLPSSPSPSDDISVVGTPSNPRPWLLLLGSAAEKGRPDLSARVINLMHMYKQPTFPATCVLHILAYTNAGDADGAKKMYQSIINAGLGPVSAFALRAVVEALCQHGRLEEGLELFQRDVLPQPQPAHNSVFQAICFHLMVQGRKEEAVDLLKHAHQHGILFGEVVMLQMNEACRKANRYDVLFDWFSELRNLGIIYGVPAFMYRNDNSSSGSNGEDGSSDGDSSSASSSSSSSSSSSFAHPSWRGRKSRSRKASAKNYKGRLRTSFISDSQDDTVLDPGFNGSSSGNIINGDDDDGGGDMLTREIRPPSGKMSSGANAALSYERAMYFLQHGGHSEQALVVFSWMTQDGLIPRSTTCRIAFEVYASLGKAKEAWELYVTMRREGISLSYTEFINVLTALIADVSLPRNPFTKRASSGSSPPLSSGVASEDVGHGSSSSSSTNSGGDTIVSSGGAVFGFTPSPAVVKKLEEAVKVPVFLEPQPVWSLSFPKRFKWKKLESSSSSSSSSSGEKDANGPGTITTTITTPSEPDNNDDKPPPPPPPSNGSSSNKNNNYASPLLEKTIGALSLRWPLVLALIHDYHTLFPTMRETHLETIAISAAAKRGWVGGGDAVYKLMLQDGVQPKVQTFNALIMGCSRVKNSKKAFAYFETMQAMQTMPDVYTCTTLLDTCGAGKKLISAQKLWKWMVHTSGIRVDMFCLNSAMRCFLDCQRPDLALAVLEQAMQHAKSANTANKGTSSLSVTFGDLCTVLGKYRQWDSLKLSNAIRTWVQYQIGSEKDPRMLTRSDIVARLNSNVRFSNSNSYGMNTVLSWNDVLTFFDSVSRLLDLPATTTTTTTTLSLGGANDTVDSNSNNNNNSNSQDGSGEGGEGNFAEFLPDALTYSYWISACYHTGDLKKTLKLRTKATKGGLKISSESFLCCLLAASEYKRGDSTTADCMSMLESLRKGGYPVDAYTLTTLMTTVCRKKSNGIEEAHKLLDHWMTSTSSSSSSSSSPGDQQQHQQQMPTKFMLSSLLSVHANQGGAGSGLDLFYNMQSTYNIKPDEISFNIVLDGLGKAGLWEEGIELVLYGMKNGLCPPSFLPASKGGLSAGYFNKKDVDKKDDAVDDSTINDTTSSSSGTVSIPLPITTSTQLPSPLPSPLPTTASNSGDIVTSFGVSSEYARERRARRMAAATSFPTPALLPAAIIPITTPLVVNTDNSNSSAANNNNNNNTKTTPSTKSNGNSQLIRRIDILDLHNFAVHSTAVILRAWLLMLKVQAIKGNRVDDTVRIVTGQGLGSSFPGVSKLRPVVQRAFSGPDEDVGTIDSDISITSKGNRADDNSEDSTIEDSNASTNTTDDDHPHHQEDQAPIDTSTNNNNKAGWGIIGKRPLQYTVPLQNQGVIKVRPDHLYNWLMDDGVDLGVGVGSEKGMALGEELFQAAITIKHGGGGGNK